MAAAAALVHRAGRSRNKHPYLALLMSLPLLSTKQSGRQNTSPSQRPTMQQPTLIRTVEEGALAKRTTEKPMSSKFLLVLGCFHILLVCSCNKQSPVSNVVFVDSPCILAAKPSEYGDHEIKVLAHIWSTREGAFIWGDGCKYPGIRLDFSESLTRDAKFQLYQATATTLVKATLIGKFRYKRFTSLRALVFGDKTFETEQVIEPQFDSTNGTFPSEGKTPTNTLPHESGHAVNPPRPQ